MTSKFRSTAVALLGCGLAACSAAQEQSRAIPKLEYKPLEFRASSQRDMWHAVMLISAGVAVIGVIDDDSTLTILGIAGVVLSLVETNGSAFQMRARRGFDFVKSGPLSLGVNPFGRTPVAHGVTGAGPGAYVQLSFKF